MKALGDYISKELSRDEGLAWEVFLQGLDVTSNKLVNEARKECEHMNPQSQAIYVHKKKNDFKQRMYLF